jgi:hypothetical protein
MNIKTTTNMDTPQRIFNTSKKLRINTTNIPVVTIKEYLMEAIAINFLLSVFFNIRFVRYINRQKSEKIIKSKSNIIVIILNQL